MYGKHVLYPNVLGIIGRGGLEFFPYNINKGVRITKGGLEKLKK